MQGNTQFFIINGVSEISNIIFIGSPGYNYSIQLQTDSIDTSKPSNKIIQINGQLSQQEDIVSEIYINLRECEVGE